jgi:Tfp pilus assembly protein PilO
MLALPRQVRERTVWLAMASLTALTMLAAYLCLFKQPLAEYRRLAGRYADLSARTEATAPEAGMINQLQKELARLDEALQGGGGGAMPVKQFQARLARQLDAASAHHGVRLVAIQPGPSQAVSLFEELPFNIEVKGEYPKVFEWMRAVTGELRLITVKSFEATPDADFQQVYMKLEMVSYRLADTGSQ